MTKIYSEKNRKVLENKDVLVGYFLAGYPNTGTFFDLIEKLQSTSLEILEIGFPSKNPYADGKVIQEAHYAVNVQEWQDINFWRELRRKINKPIWIMAYREDFISNGKYKTFAKEGLYDGLVIPDCTNEEQLLLQSELKEWNIDVLRFIKPTLTLEEMQSRLQEPGMIYAQLYDGPTGVKDVVFNYGEMLKLALEYDGVRLFAGFGINDKERVSELYSEGFHGVIVGTAILKKLQLSVEDVIKFINNLKSKKGGNEDGLCNHI